MTDPAAPIGGELAGGRVLAGRVGLSVLDQALSAGTNLAVTLLAARVLSAREFGAFGIAYLAAIAIGGAVRSALGGPVLIFQPEALADRGAKPHGAAVAAGLLGAVVLASAGAATGGDLRGPLLALSVTLPGLLVQDMARSLAFADLRPGRALALDALWAVGLVVGLVVAAARGPLTATAIMAAWGISATVSGLWALWTAGRLLPLPSTAWLRDTWEFAWRYFLTFASTLGVTQVTGLLLGVISGVTAVGAVRAAQVVFGPVQNLSLGMMVALVPDTTLETPLHEQRKRLMGASAFLTLVATVMTAVALVVPDGLGEAFLGETWPAARAIMLPAGLTAGLLGAMTGAMIGLRAARAAHDSLVVGLQLSALQLVLPIGFAIGFDAPGYMWASAATYLLGTVLWWRRYLRIEHTSGGPGSATPGPTPPV